jgi:hypothetical protein
MHIPLEVEGSQFAIAVGQEQTALHAMLAHHYEPAHAVAESFASTVKYRLDPEVMRQDGGATPNPVLSPTGDNLVAVLDAINSSGNR